MAVSAVENYSCQKLEGELTRYFDGMLHESVEPPELGILRFLFSGQNMGGVELEEQLQQRDGTTRTVIAWIKDDPNCEQIECGTWECTMDEQGVTTEPKRVMIELGKKAYWLKTPDGKLRMEEWKPEELREKCHNTNTWFMMQMAEHMARLERLVDRAMLEIIATCTGLAIGDDGECVEPVGIPLYYENQYVTGTKPQVNDDFLRAIRRQFARGNQAQQTRQIAILGGQRLLDWTEDANLVRTSMWFPNPNVRTRTGFDLYYSINYDDVMPKDSIIALYYGIFVPFQYKNHVGYVTDGNDMFIRKWGQRGMTGLWMDHTYRKLSVGDRCYKYTYDAHTHIDIFKAPQAKMCDLSECFNGSMTISTCGTPGIYCPPEPTDCDLIDALFTRNDQYVFTANHSPASDTTGGAFILELCSGVSYSANPATTDLVQALAEIEAAVQADYPASTISYAPPTPPAVFGVVEFNGLPQNLACAYQLTWLDAAGQRIGNKLSIGGQYNVLAIEGLGDFANLAVNVNAGAVYSGDMSDGSGANYVIVGGKLYLYGIKLDADVEVVLSAADCPDKTVLYAWTKPVLLQKRHKSGSVDLDGGLVGYTDEDLMQKVLPWIKSKEDGKLFVDGNLYVRDYQVLVRDTHTSGQPTADKTKVASPAPYGILREGGNPDGVGINANGTEAHRDRGLFAEFKINTEKGSQLKIVFTVEERVGTFDGL